VSVERRIQRVLVAARGRPAAERVEVYEGAGIECVVVFGSADADDAHLDVAAWACPLPASVADATEGDALLRAIVGVAMDAGADAFDPSGTPFAHESHSARYVASVGLAWLGGSPDALSTNSTPPPDRAHRCVTCLCDGEGAAVVVADAWIERGRTVLGSVDVAGVSVPQAAARTTRAAGVVNVHLGAAGEVLAVSFGLPEHHAQVRVGDRPLAAAAVAMIAGEGPGSPRDSIGET
jgi:hypothetical protein